ncbi:MICOS complex subunit Mic10-like [Cimex lectularius]|uniref:MICOS complex subunit MIC10 n=1 Tax=Cimex lectularius TaxID=79782 RepID=A0A8I6RK04_CIMLE|nr:MICOS complex subunit Mic10-like [Cimex lectularius]
MADVAQPPFYEDQLLWRVNRCMSDALIKSIFSSGMTILAAKFFYPKMKASSAAIAGAGIGLGMAYLNCERELKSTMSTQCLEEEKKKQLRKLICEEEKKK